MKRNTTLVGIAFILGVALFLTFEVINRGLATGKTIPRAASQIALLDYKGYADLYVWNTKTNDLTQLTRGYKLSQAVWSPDGEWLLLVTRDGELHLLDPGTAETDRVDTGQAKVGNAVWSPDGRRIAFAGDGKIYVVNADGTNLNQLAAGVSPGWAPNGKQIIFVNKDETGTSSIISEVREINADGGVPQTVLTFSGIISMASLSPNGDHILFLERFQKNDVLSGAGVLYIVNAAGNDLQKLNPPVGSDELPPVNPDSPPSWSPDGQEILFASSSGDIYRYALETGEFTLAAAAKYEHPVWNAAGGRIAYQGVFLTSETCIASAQGVSCVDLDLNGPEPVGWRP